MTYLLSMETCDVEEAAAILKANRTTILELAGSGALEGAKIGKCWVFLREDVFAYLRNQIRAQSQARRQKAAEQEAYRQKIAAAPTAAPKAISPARRGRRPKYDREAMLASLPELAGKVAGAKVGVASQHP